MNLAPNTSDLARIIKKNELVIGVPASQHMIPGKTYVGHLPGHSRKAFVRKREYTSKPLSRVTGVGAALTFGPDTSHEVELRTKMPRWLRSMFGSDYDTYDDRYRRRRVIYTDGTLRGISAAHTVTSSRQVCSVCGKFRSPSWSARHPLRYGETPRSSMCRKCVGKSTSSAETPSNSRRRRCHRHCRDRRHSNYTDDQCFSHDSSKDSCRLCRRYRSDSLGYIRPRSLLRSGSSERVDIVIQNEEVAPRTRVRAQSPSDGAVRIVHRIAVDRPVRYRTLRSVSSDPTFTDEVAEEVLPRRRPLSRARARSRSSVHFIDELEEPCYRHRPRNLSRRSSVEDIVDSRPRGSSLRRRRVFCDGAADTQMKDKNADQVSANEKVGSAAVHGKNLGIADSWQRPTILGCRRSSSVVSSGSLPPTTIGQARVLAKSSRCASSVSSHGSHLGQVGKRSQNIKYCSEKSQIAPSAAEAWSLHDRTQATSADPGYEFDSQFPSPPSVTFAVPVFRRSRTLTLSHVPTVPAPTKTRHSERRRRHTEPLSPAYSNDGAFPAVPHQIFCERVRHKSEPLSPPDSNQDPRNPFASFASSTSKPVCISAATTTADSPDHPDHLAFLLSTAQISQSTERESHRETKEEDRERPTNAALLMTQHHDRSPSYSEYTRADSIISSLDGGPEVDNMYQTGFRVAVAEELGGGTDRSVDFAGKDFYYRNARRNAMHDIFDEEELEQRYYESQADYEAEGRVHMQALKKRMAMQEKEAMHQRLRAHATHTV